MRVGILTLNDYGNVGNRLQAYALPYYLKKLFANKNVDVENIFFTPNSYILDNKIINLKFIRKFVFNRHEFRTQVNRNEPFFDIIKQYNFKKFTDKLIPTNYAYNFTEEIEYLYDYFVIGSDQIWNPNVGDKGDLAIYKYISRNKRIAYAPSIGVPEIPDSKIDIFIDMLNNTKTISVREQQGATIIKDLINKDVPVLVDPTLLLTKEEWLNIAEKPLWYKNEKYIFVYYINDMPNKVKNEINNIATSNNLKIIDIMDRSNLDYYTVSPQEFIYLIKNASFVYTDSFHGTVFSILMKVPFVTCPRENASMNMNSRVESLLRLFELQERLATQSSEYKIRNLFDINFSLTDNILNKERKKSHKFLLEAFANSL